MRRTNAGRARARPGVAARPGAPWICITICGNSRPHEPGRRTAWRSSRSRTFPAASPTSLAVDNVSFEVKAGEFFTLLGPSGCGKTTLLRMIAGFDLPDAGSIVLDGVDLRSTPPERRPIHTVFQSYALFPHMTVAQNIAFPLQMAGQSEADLGAKVKAALEQVKLTAKGGSFPHELSGGQKQRVALARGLVNRPRLLLLDEPLGALDAKLREQMQLELIRLQKDSGVTFVFVTHAQAEALALSHRIAVMNHGRIEQLDEPSRLYGFPKNRFVADFIGNVNMLDVTVAEAGAPLKLTCPKLGTIAAPAREGAEDGHPGRVRHPPGARRDPRARRAAVGRPQPVRGQGLRFPVHRRRDDLHRRPRQRRAHRGAARQLGAGPRQVLRGRRRGPRLVEGRSRRLPRRLRRRGHRCRAKPRAAPRAAG